MLRLFYEKNNLRKRKQNVLKVRIIILTLHKFTNDCYMKKIYTMAATCAATLCLTLPAEAAGLGQRSPFAPVQQEGTQKQLESLKHRSSGYERFDAQRLANARNRALKGRKAHQEEAGLPDASTIITTAPAGTVSLTGRDCTGYLPFWGMIFDLPYQGIASTRVDAEDGAVYLSNPFSTLPIENFLKWEKDAEGNLSITGAQAIYTEEYEGETLVGYAVPMSSFVDDEGVWVWAEPGLTYTLTYDAATGTYKSPESQGEDFIILGMCVWDLGVDPEGNVEENYQWIGYGDLDAVMYTVNDEPVEAPVELATEEWTFLSVSEYGDLTGYHLNVGFEGDNCWIQGLNSSMPDAWIKGSVSEGEVTFANGQFMGIDNFYGQLCYFTGASAEFELWDEEDPELGDWVYYVTAAPLVLTYNPEASLLTSMPQRVAAFAGKMAEDITETEPYAVLSDFRIVKQTYVPGTPPAPVTDLMVYPYEELDEYGVVEFNYLPLDENGVLLDTNSMFYEVYIDGDLYTFTPEVYVNLESEMVLVPYDFNDDFDFMSMGAYKSFAYMVPEAEKIGIRPVYVHNGEEVFGTLVECEVEGAVKVLSTGNRAKEAVVYDMLGRRMHNGAKGLLIVDGKKVIR